MSLPTTAHTTRSGPRGARSNCSSLFMPPPYDPPLTTPAEPVLGPGPSGLRSAARRPSDGPGRAFATAGNGARESGVSTNWRENVCLSLGEP